MPIITQRAYRQLIQRQERVEREVELLRHIFRQATDEASIRPSVLKRWERISRDLDRGKGRGFVTARDARQWLKKL
mgnify:CR=1 FL=1